MKYKINITTPAGKSLEGFPFEVEDVSAKETTTNTIFPNCYMEIEPPITLHTGDTITIEVIE